MCAQFFECIIEPLCAHYFPLKTCLEGLDNVDAHIGGDELHHMCYSILQKKWLAWSKGYMVPIERTTLWGVKLFATIAGKDLTEPVKQHNAIWHFFFKVCGKGTEPKFKANQLELAVIIDHEELAHVELTKEDSELTGVNALTKVSNFIPVLFVYCSSHL